MAEKPFAFVLMPFETSFDDIYSVGIKPAAEAAGYVAQRVDEQIFTETILSRIYRQIETADIIIADMSGRNANVFYEVGYAHAKNKLCTLLTQKADDIPFDLRHHRHLVYGDSIKTLNALLRADLEHHKTEIEARLRGIFEVNVKPLSGQLIKTAWSATADINIDIDLQFTSAGKSPEIEAIYLHTGPKWKYLQDGNSCASQKSAIADYSEMHFIRSPVTRLSSGAWAPLKLNGSKILATSFGGKELKDSYKLAGRTLLEIVTSSGNFRKELNFEVEVDELPF
jgi:hypothetical protein